VFMLEEGGKKVPESISGGWTRFFLAGGWGRGTERSWGAALGQTPGPTTRSCKKTVGGGEKRQCNKGSGDPAGAGKQQSVVKNIGVRNNKESRDNVFEKARYLTHLRTSWQNTKKKAQ